MRYRPFARAGMAVSALSLILDGTEEGKASDWRDLLHAAFEEGVNAFEIVRPSSELLRGFAEGAAAVRRSLLFIGLRVGDATDAAHLTEWIDAVLGEAGLAELDLLTLESDPALAAGIPAAVRALRDQGRVKRLALC